ncbi:hypothetical protein EBB59_07800 [Lysobacter pythonis]|uniref:Secretin/TonB short N-terminal domain-containing protein n=1 Tax=Solilutibacter pythonis TaxID=2483112 RepID=A0A3M2HSW8_9GAMM|nr:secretin and TonB N-terminal domain-containing protein [Lysobacter pythonis]RMH92856.1 hypothetical protein EBB59_07800 [Lysobacter pythonis]
MNPNHPSPWPARRWLTHALCLSILATATATPFPVLALQGKPVQPGGRLSIDIPPGELGPALRRFATLHELTLAFTPESVAGRRTQGLSGTYDVEQGLNKLLAGSGLSYRFESARTIRLLPGSEAPPSQENVMQTAPLNVMGGWTEGALPAYVSAYGGRSLADTGTRVLSGGGYQARIAGDGDANSVLRGMANVQYQNDASNDAGYDGMREIDMRPLEVSISGGKLYENNFRINGIGVNNLSGRVEKPSLAGYCGDVTHDYCTVHDQSVIYGLHSQTVFVPDTFVESVTVVDSNASARYGDFQGGVVDYKLADPKDAFGMTFNHDRSGSDWVNYRLGTKNGENRYNRLKPYFRNDKYALSVNVPVRDGWAMSLSYSQQDAHSRKQRDAQYVNDSVIEDASTSRYYRLASRHDTAYGKFTLDANRTDYTNSFINVAWLDTVFDVRTRGLTSQLRHEIDLDGLRWARVGLGGVSLTSRLFHNDSRVLNKSDRDTIYTPYGAKAMGRGARRWIWESEELRGICRYAPSDSSCRQGGHGERQQSQKETGLSVEMDGDIFHGRFNAGFDWNRATVERMRPRDAWFYSSYRTVADDFPTDWKNRRFICAEGDSSCSAEQYASMLTGYSAYRATASVDMLSAHAEYDRRWGHWSLRAGLRADYESYFRNTNLSPRMVLSFLPHERVSLSAGFNRYYNGAALYYAIRDQQPSQVNYRIDGSSRRADPVTGKVRQDWKPHARRYVSYRDAGLDTPYTDEITSALQWHEPWLDGSLRLRLIDRRGKDQFATSKAASREFVLTNDGRSRYRSASLEYRKSWSDTPLADQLGVSLSTTWSRRATSSSTYFDDDGQTSPDDFIYYRERTYTRATFQEVTGNLDIPVRSSLVVDSDWLDNRLSLALSFDHNFSYDAVRDSATDIVIDDQRYNVYEDYRAKATTTVGLSGTWQAWSGDTAGVSLRFRVNNLFNDFGNAYASANRPWLRGRSFWAGVALRF